MSEYSRTVPPEGDVNSKIAFIGEAPSYNEVVEGRPFVGRAGQQFNDFLLHARITRKEVYITNLFKVPVQKTSKPQEKYWIGDTLLYSSKDGFTEEGMRYVNQLYDELRSGGFNLIVPMGNPAMLALIGKVGVTKRRGSIYWSTEVDKKVMPTIHPAASMRQYLFKHYIIADFRRAKEQAEFSELKPHPRSYILKPKYVEALNYLDDLLEGTQVAFDIEVMRGEVSCISFSEVPSFAMVIPFHYEGQPFYTLEQEAEIWKRIGLVLEDEGIKKVGQNLAFDTTFLYEKYGIVTRNIDDTMVAHRMLFPDYPARLDFLCSMYTDLPYYKDEGKQYFKWGEGDDAFLLYNAKDSVVCIETMPQLEEDLKKIGNYASYIEQVKLLQPLTFMGLKGILVDEKTMAEHKVKMEVKLLEYQEGLNKIVGMELNANSPKQVATYFYVHKGIAPYKKDNKITTNDGAMKRIARKGFPEAQIILKIRHIRKMIGTYYDVKLKDSRLRCSYDPAKKTGRVGTSEDIFGYGTNVQNQPFEMNKFFIADSGYLLYSVDLSQADNRSVAYIAPELRMIKAFEDGDDVHSLTAHLIFNIPIDEIKQMDKEKVMAPIGYADQTHRYWGKKSNHSLNYGMGYKLFSYVLEIPEKQGKEIWEKYHRAYPGVQKSYHKMVRDKLHENRTLTNSFGRKYLFLDRWSDQLFNQAYAFIPQSNTADIINRHGIIPIYYSTKKYGSVELLRQVHDSIDFQIPISIGVKEHARILMDIKEELEQPISWKAYSFVIPAEFKVGKSLDPMEKLVMDDTLEKQLKQVVNREG